MVMKRIHVNRQIIASNSKQNKNNPPLAIRSYPRGRKTAETVYYGHKVDIIDESGKAVATVVYSPDKPLECGAKVWIETELDVKVE